MPPIGKIGKEAIKNLPSRSKLESLGMDKQLIDDIGLLRDEEAHRKAVTTIGSRVILDKTGQQGRVVEPAKRFLPGEREKVLIEFDELEGQPKGQRFVNILDVSPAEDLSLIAAGGILVETLDDATGEFFERSAELEDAQLDLEISVLAGPDAPRTGLLGDTQLRASTNRAADRPETGLTRFAGGVESIGIGGLRDALVQMAKTIERITSAVEIPPELQTKGDVPGISIQDLPEIPLPEGLVGQMARGVVQFFAGFAAGGAALKGMDLAVRLGRLTPEVQSLVSTLAAFSPEDPTIANLIAEMNPEFQGPFKALVDVLATNLEDSDALNLAKRAVEDILLGRGAVGVALVAKGGAFLTKAAAGQVMQIIDQTAELISSARLVQRATQGVEVTRGVLDLNRPPITTEATPIPALKLKDGTVVFDKEAQIHVEVQENLNIPVEQIEEGGFIFPGGEFVEGSGRFPEFAERIRQAQASSVSEVFRSANKNTKELFAKAIDKAVEDGKIPKGLTTREAALLKAGGLEKVDMKPGDFLMKGDEGKVQAAVLFALGRAGVGGAIGFAAGPERNEEAIKSALVLAGLGALASPAMLKALAKRRLLKKAERAFKQSQVKADDLEKERTILQTNPTGLDPAQVEARIGELDQEIANLKRVEAFDETTRKSAEFRRTNQQAAKQGNEYLQEVEKQRRGTVPREQTAAEAAANPMTVEEVQALMPGTTLNAEQARAMINVLQGSAEKMMALREVAIETGTDEAKREFLGQLLLHGTMDPKRLGVLAEAGRTLGELNQPVSGINQFLDQFTDLLAKSGETGLSMDRLLGMVGDLKTPAQLRHFAKQLTKPTFKDFFFEYWINALLSGPQTHVVNFLGNTITALWAIPERALAARLTKAGVNGIEKGEAKAMLYAGLSGIGDALILAGRVLREGESAATGLSKVETPRVAALTAQNLELSGFAGRAVDFIGAVIRTPGRLLMSSDEFFKGINFRMEVHAQAFRKVSQETFANADEMAARLKFLQDNPGEEVFKAAREFGAYQTFTNELGPSGKAISALSNSHPLMKLVLPFIRTPLNIAKYTFQRMPGLNRLGTQHAADLAAGGARADLARGKQALGGMVMGLVSLATLGGFISGRGPADPRLQRGLRDAGWKPYAIKVGDRWIQYNRLDPVGMLLGMAADMTTFGVDIVESGEYSRAAGAIWLATANNLTSKTYLRGVSEVLAVAQPRFHAKPEDLLKNKRTYLGRLVGSLVPAFSAQLARNMDPAIKDARGIIDEILARIPGASVLVTNKLNIFGDVITPGGSLGPGLLSPIYTDTETKDPVKLAIQENEVALSMPSEHIRGVRLLQDEYWEYVKLAGVPAKKELDRYVGSRQYQRDSDGPEGGKALEIRQIIQFHRTEAAALMEEKFPDLREQIEKKELQKIEALSPKRSQEVSPQLTR